VLQHSVVDRDADLGQSSAPWWIAHQASDVHVERFLQLLAGLSKTEWQSIRLRSKHTKAYGTAIQDIEHLKSLYPERAALWGRARADAAAIARRNASWGSISPYELGHAAADRFTSSASTEPSGSPRSAAVIVSVSGPRPSDVLTFTGVAPKAPGGKMRPL